MSDLKEAVAKAKSSKKKRNKPIIILVLLLVLSIGMNLYLAYPYIYTYFFGRPLIGFEYLQSEMSFFEGALTDLIDEVENDQSGREQDNTDYETHRELWSDVVNHSRNIQRVAGSMNNDPTFLLSGISRDNLETLTGEIRNAHGLLAYYKVKAAARTDEEFFQFENDELEDLRAIAKVHELVVDKIEVNPAYDGNVGGEIIYEPDLFDSLKKPNEYIRNRRSEEKLYPGNIN
ncbi:hypothetical protein [Natranaerobius thermophilus]|uniref:Uncharacterized protein n=1 Tax=Natranaerobius thermophilus (strain ATCC BAA-1301 / DSM 18059 / JW/NM-WN-LF) TaxID=457570 RepID=B2A8P6_NATTJ|nr:hypothetical protein [Natranaerobius thermophilus]ACB86495.1 hypothetical protein Nther_2950 [Natranaerobius thermophilus JW/NM-WN-LF]